MFAVCPLPAGVTNVGTDSAVGARQSFRVSALAWARARAPSLRVRPTPNSCQPCEGPGSHFLTNWLQPSIREWREGQRVPGTGEERGNSRTGHLFAFDSAGCFTSFPKSRPSVLTGALEGLQVALSWGLASTWRGPGPPRDGSLWGLPWSRGDRGAALPKQTPPCGVRLPCRPASPPAGAVPVSLWGLASSSWPMSPEHHSQCQSWVPRERPTSLLPSLPCWREHRWVPLPPQCLQPCPCSRPHTRSLRASSPGQLCQPTPAQLGDGPGGGLDGRDGVSSPQSSCLLDSLESDLGIGSLQM